MRVGVGGEFRFGDKVLALDWDCVCGHPANERHSDGVGAVVEQGMVDALAAMWGLIRVCRWVRSQEGSSPCLA